MKIGIIGTRGIPNRYGGFEQFAELLSAGLAAKGHEVYVYNSSLHHFTEDKFGDVYIIHCRDREDKLGTIGQFFYDRNCLLDAGKRNFDVLLHLGYTSDAIWHRLWPKQSVNMVNMDGMEWKRNKYNRVTRKFLRQAEYLAARNADIMIADSVGIHQHLLNTYKKKSAYIPYSAEIFTSPDVAFLKPYKILPQQYYLLIARMEPENNIEMIIKGFQLSSKKYPLLIVGNTSTSYGKYLKSKYDDEKLVYTEGIYNQAVLNNLRFYSAIYFHGHSVGGTNPSLLEAMGCNCSIAAHDNIFNKCILGNEADYFSDEKEVSKIFSIESNQTEERKKANLQKIKETYSHEKIINAYEELMMHAVALHRTEQTQV